MSVPKLRFKEFQDAWSPCVLNDFVSFAKGKGIAKADIDDDGINFCIRYGELYTTYGQVIRTVVSKTNIAENDSILSKAGDVIIPASGETQIDIATAACVTQNGIILGGDLNILSHSENGEWLAYYLSSAKKFEIAQLAQGNSVVHLYSSQLKDLSINKPSRPEQTKIASFLSAVDDKIACLVKEHELWQHYKQGMMQQLFSQTLRFQDDDGQDFPEWEEKKIGDITHLVSAGATPATAKREYWGGNIKWMNSGELNLRHVYDVENRITELGYKSSSTRLLPKYCVLIGLAGQGKTRGTVAINHIELCTNQSIAAIHPNDDLFDYRFIYFNLDMRYQELRSLSTGDGGRGGLNLQIIRDICVPIPSLPEQTKIAACLSSIDDKIDSVAQQLEQARLWKQGLLQQMFV